MSRNLPNIQRGDVVKVLKHKKTARLYPDRSWTVPEESGWVVTGKMYFGEQFHDPGFLSERDCFTLEKLPEPDEGWQPNRMEFIHREHLVIEQKGNGTFTRGVDLPFNKAQLHAQALEAFKSRAALAIVNRGKHEGWTNPATWHVNLQLTNCREFVNNLLPGLWRKDGTINPKRLIKTWRDLKRQGKVQPVEDWMYELPLDIPAEFARHNFKDVQDAHLRVDWFEIAADMKRKTP